MHQVKEKIIDEIRSLNLSQIEWRQPYSDNQLLALRRSLDLFDELIEEHLGNWGLRDYPDVLIDKARSLRLLGRYNEAHECLLEAYNLEFRNLDVYTGMIDLYQQMGATDCAENWMCSYIDQLYANQRP